MLSRCPRKNVFSSDWRSLRAWGESFRTTSSSVAPNSFRIAMARDFACESPAFRLSANSVIVPESNVFVPSVLIVTLLVLSPSRQTVTTETVVLAGWYL